MAPPPPISATEKGNLLRTARARRKVPIDKAQCIALFKGALLKRLLDGMLKSKQISAADAKRRLAGDETAVKVRLPSDSYLYEVLRVNGVGFKPAAPRVDTLTPKNMTARVKWASDLLARKWLVTHLLFTDGSNAIWNHSLGTRPVSHGRGPRFSIALSYPHSSHRKSFCMYVSAL